jgi:hypothetical protein
LIQDTEKGFLEIDFESSIFEVVLKYIYTGSTKISISNWKNVLSCANYFGIDRIRKICFDYMIGSLNEESAIGILEKAEKGEFDFDCTLLIQKCIEVMEKKAYNLIKTKSFLMLSEKAIILMLKKSSTNAPEIDLFMSCIKWAEHQKNKNNDERDVKEILENIFQYIRFPIMTSDQLVNVVKPMGLISKELYKNAIEYIAFPGIFHLIQKNLIKLDSIINQECLDLRVIF